MNEGAKSKGPNAMEKYLASVAKNQAGATDFNPKSTKATSLANANKRESVNARRTEEERKRKEDANRIKEQNKLKGTVQAAFKEKFGGKSASQIVNETVELMKQ